MDSAISAPRRVARAVPRVMARGDAAALGFLFGLLLLLWLASSPAFLPLPHRDPGIYLYMGQRMNQGAQIYTEVWFHNAPLIAYINAFGLTLGRGSVWGVWALELLFLAGAVALGFAALRRSFGRWPATVASFAWIVMLNLLLLTGNQREEWNLLFQFGALYCFLRSEDNWRWAIAGGVLLGLTLFLGQNLVGIGLVIGAYLLLRIALHAGRPAVLRLAGFVLGGVSVILVVIGFFAAQGILGDLWESGFAYNFLYAGGTPSQRVTAVLYGIGKLEGSGLPVLAVAGYVAAWAALVRSRRRLLGDRPLLVLALLALPLELFLSSLSGRPYMHYFIAWIPTVAILVAFVAERIVGGRDAAPRGAWAVALIVGIGLLPAVSFVTTMSGRPLNPSGYVQDRVVRYLRENTTPEQSVLVWGAEPVVNFLAERRAPTRYFFQYPLYMVGYQSPALYQRFLDELQADPPALIIDTSPTHLMAAPFNAERRAAWVRQSRTDPRWDERAADIHYDERMDVIFDYVARHYERIGAFGNGWEVYRRVPGAGLGF